MGQIIGGAAKPKRCNISELSQLGTPSAGEYILVSSDISMNAAGQGNFDFYIVGDGTTAASELEVQPIPKTALYKKYPKESILVNSGYISTSGELTTSTTFSHSDYIPVKEGDVVFYTGFGGNSSVSAIYSYSSSKNKAGSLLNGNTNKIYNNVVTIPSGVAYIKVTAGNSTHTKYVPSTHVLLCRKVSLDVLTELEETQNDVLILNSDVSNQGEELDSLASLFYERPFIVYELTDNEKIIEDSVITSQDANVWYAFHSSASWSQSKNAWQISVNNQTYGGLRSNNLWSLLNTRKTIDFTKDIYLLVDVYVETNGLRLFELNIDDVSSSALFYKDLNVGWNRNIAIKIPANTYSSLSDVSRLQFWVEDSSGWAGTWTGTYYICNFDFSQQFNEDNINLQFAEIDKSISILEESIANRPYKEYALPVDAKLVKDSTISSSTSNPWYQFRSSAIWDNTYEAWKITGNNTSFPGLRSDTIWSIINGIGEIDFTKDIYLVFDLYIPVNGMSLYEYNGDTMSESTVYRHTLKSGWNKNVTIKIPANTYSGISDFSRLQIWVASSSSYGEGYMQPYYVRNFGFSQEYLEDNIPARLTALESEVNDTYYNGKKLAIIGDSISSSARFQNYSIEILSSDVGNSLDIYITYFDLYEQDTTTPRSQTIGGVSLTDAMIGTKQTFTPVAADVGKRFGVNYVYNSDASLKTWGELVANNLGMEVIGNSQWSGASMCSGQTGLYVGTSGWSDYTIAACSTRDSEGNAENPDVILIYRGVNDLSHGQGGYGYSRIDAYDMMANGYPQSDFDGTYYQFRRAYYMSIAKLRTAYPNALIFCCTLNVFKRITYDRFPTRNGVYSLPQLNAAIRDIANEMGCGLIELDKDGITFENCYPTYISDSATTPTHPNQNGHKQMARKAVADMIGYIKQVSE